MVQDHYELNSSVFGEAVDSPLLCTVSLGMCYTTQISGTYSLNRRFPFYVLIRVSQWK